VTVSKELDQWYISVQTEREVESPKHPVASDIGIDMGIKTFAAVSDGMMIPPIQSFKTYSQKLAIIQRKLSRKKKGSGNWKKVETLLSKTHQKVGRIRQDFLHKTSANLSKNHALIFVEDLKVKNMSASAKGTADQPGKNVKAKGGLNRSILDQGWFEFRRQLAYKQVWRGGGRFGSSDVYEAAMPGVSLNFSRSPADYSRNPRTLDRGGCQLHFPKD
jgi:putative transposase